MAKSRSTSKSSTTTVRTKTKNGTVTQSNRTSESNSDKKRSNSSSNRILLVIFILVFGYGFMSLLRQEASKAESNVLFSDRILFYGEYLKEYNFNLEDDNYFVYDPLVNNHYLDYYDYEIVLQIDDEFGNFDYTTISTFNIWESVEILLPEVDNFNIRLSVLGNNSVDMMFDYSIQKDYVKPLVHGSNLEIKHNYSDVKQMKSWGSTIMGQQRLAYIVGAIDILANTMDFLYNTVFTVTDALLNFFDFIIYNMIDAAETIINLDFKNWWNNMIESFRKVSPIKKPDWAWW